MNRVLSRDCGERLGERQKLGGSMTWHNWCYRREQQMYLSSAKVLLRCLQCLDGYYVEEVMVVLLQIENEVGVQVKQHMMGR